MIDLILTAFGISLFCIGLYITTEDGYILDFLRKPYNRIYDELQLIEQRKGAEFSYNHKRYVRYKCLLYVLKPLIGCPICYASFWSCVWHTALYGFTWGILPSLIMCMFMSAYFNAILLNIYHRTE